MLNRIRLTLVLLALIIIPCKPQGVDFNEYVVPNSISPTVALASQAISSGSSYTDLWIIATDYGASNLLPGWFNPNLFTT